MAIQQGLFGASPEQIMQSREEADYARNLAAVRLSPMEQSNLMLRQAGSQAGQIGASLLGIEDPQMQAAREAQSLASKYDLTTSAGLKDLILGLQDRAQQTGNQALAGLIPQAAAAYQRAALNEATIADKMEKKTPSQDEIVKQGLYAVALQEAGGDPNKAAIIYNNRIQAEKNKVAASGVAVPASGQVDLTVLGKAINIADEFTAKPKAKLDQIKIVASIGQGVKSNPTLLPQFQREAVKFAGDNQISAQEVNRVLGSSGFAADTIDGFNKFLTGAPTDTKIDDVLRGFKVLEQAFAKQYETGRKKADTVLKEGKINDQTRNAVLPAAYNTTPGAPPLNDWLTKAKVANPGVSDADLTTYYNNKYPKAK
jgi:hypothetical protein